VCTVQSMNERLEELLLLYYGKVAVSEVPNGVRKNVYCGVAVRQNVKMA